MSGKKRSRGPVLRTLIWIAVTAGLLCASALYATRAYTPQIKDQAGRVLSESVASLERVSLGGVPQYILVRGKNRSNPVLLFLHGGPGMPMMFLSHAFQKPLEEEFVVVQWDRRGAGKSYDSRIPPQTISVQQEIADTRELTELLRSNPEPAATNVQSPESRAATATLPQEARQEPAAREGQQPEAPQRGYSVKVNVDSVFLNVAVQERNTNRSVAGLKKEDFLVYEDGALQQVDQFLPSEAPINLLLLLDVSGSTGFYLHLMKGASIDFIRKAKSNDRLAIAAFSSRVDLIQNFTNDRIKAEQAIQRIWAGGGTSFYDALMTCLDQYMRGVEGRSAIVIFTDGADNQLEGGYPAGSQTTFDELYRRIQEAESIIYPIFLDTVGQTAGGPATTTTGAAGGVLRKRIPTLQPTAPNPDQRDPQDKPEPYEIALKQLLTIADQTGGRMYSAHKIEELSGIYSEIASDLRIQYQLGYNPTNSVRDGRWREIRVKIKNHPEAVVRTRKGYYARKEGG